MISLPMIQEEISADNKQKRTAIGNEP